MNFFIFNSFIYVCLEEDSEKPVIVETKLDGIDKDDMETYCIYLHLSSSMRIWCSSYGNLKVVVNHGERTRILTKKRNQTFYKAIDVHSVKIVLGESISSISMWNTMNRLGKHNFYFG